jgi:hypothetical protein
MDLVGNCKNLRAVAQIGGGEGNPIYNLQFLFLFFLNIPASPYVFTKLKWLLA